LTIAVLVVFLILDLAALLVRLLLTGLLTRLALAGLIALLALPGLPGLTTLLALSKLLTLLILIHIVCHETLHAKRDGISRLWIFCLPLAFSCIERLQGWIEIVAKSRVASPTRNAISCEGGHWLRDRHVLTPIPTSPQQSQH
jgi:hypothetical protein